MSTTADAYDFDRHGTVILERRSLGFIAVATLLTCGLYSLVLAYSHYRVIQALEPRALGPIPAIGLSLVGYVFTAGLLSFAVDYWQWKCLDGVADQRRVAGRNRSLMSALVVTRVLSLLGLWFSWTGVFAVVVLACAIYATYLLQAELELYTVGA